MKCPKCGADLDNGYEGDHCYKCGSNLNLDEAVLSCANCGAELKGEKRCSECGTKVDSTDQKSTIGGERDKFSVPSPSEIRGRSVKRTMLGLPVVSPKSSEKGPESITEAPSRALEEKSRPARKSTGTLFGVSVKASSKVVELKRGPVEKEPKAGSEPSMLISDPEMQPIIESATDDGRSDNSAKITRRERIRPSPAPLEKESDSDINVDFGWIQTRRKWTVGILLVLLVLSSAFMLWWFYIRPY